MQSAITSYSLQLASSKYHHTFDIERVTVYRSVRSQHIKKTLIWIGSHFT